VSTGEGVASAAASSATTAADDVGPVPAPLTRERLRALCAQVGWSPRVGSEGELRVTVGLDEVALHQRGEHGEVLLVRATWHTALKVGRCEDVRAFVEEHHRRSPWPQAHLEVQDQGLVLLHTAQAVDLTEGVTDEQLRRHVADATGAAQTMFDKLAALLGLREV